MFIKIKGRTGYYNAVVTGFYKSEMDYLKRRIKSIYQRETGEQIPNYFEDINTIKQLKQFVKVELHDMDNYPNGFKHIDGVFVLYECIG